MTEQTQTARAIPTPRDLAARPARQAVPLAAAGLQPTAAVYDRHRWEEALSATVLPHYAARLLGWGLAHLADGSGYLPPGSTRTERLGAAAGLSLRQVRMSLGHLQTAGLIVRPDADTWRPQELSRPITLTMPAALTGGAQRTEPAHPARAVS